MIYIQYFATFLRLEFFPNVNAFYVCVAENSVASFADDSSGTAQLYTAESSDRRVYTGEHAS